MTIGKEEVPMSTGSEAIAVVRRNTEEVQGRGNFDIFDELFADDFVDHTPQRGFGADRTAVRVLYRAIREAFPDFRPEIHFQVAADGGMVTTYKTYHGTQSRSVHGRRADRQTRCVRHRRRHEGSRRKNRRALGGGGLARRDDPSRSIDGPVGPAMRP
jgi:hypothetical protein